MIQEDLENLATRFIVQFLGISRIGDWLLLRCIEQTDVSQSPFTISCDPRSDLHSLRARYIPHKDPLDFKDPLPLVRSPDRRVLRFIDPTLSATGTNNQYENLRCEHLCNTAKMPGSVDGEKQVDWTGPAKLAEGCVETFITQYG